jgi:hypothetical protein
MIGLSEQAILNQLVERLAQRYPGLSAETVVEVVRQHHAQFDGRLVRDYIPLFVERRARQQLALLDLQVGPRLPIPSVQSDY